MGRVTYLGLAVVLSSLQLFGCAGLNPSHVANNQWFPRPDGFPGELSPTPDIDVLSLNAAMKALLQQQVLVYATRAERAEALRRLFYRSDLLALKYDPGRTGTASETFEAGAGDCVSFANLAVAMARYAGLTASFQNVLVQPLWEKDGAIAVLKRHVNVLIEGGGVSFVYDFFPLDGPIEPRVLRISDAQARAQYFNNRGIAYFRAGDAGTALRYLDRAVHIEPALAFVWSNIGTVYSDAGQYVAAERFLRQALAVDHNNPSALVNLAELYSKMGRPQDAQAIAQRVESYRLKNPYYRYLLAELAYNSGHYQEAIEQLQRASQVQTDARFYALLAAAFSRQGDKSAALRSYRLALHLTPTAAKVAADKSDTTGLAID